ncbi:Toll/interleukin-1 receptor domain-containing protein [Tanacetum coccineum]
MASSSSLTWKYDVFLSFRGEDTRKTFIDHLYSALCLRLITYKDDITLPMGESVGPALFKAIEESRHAVVIFSKNYADSSWCLDELVHIMKCRTENGQIVIPIFYDVEPTEVRNQKWEFGEAFAKLTKMNFWRKLFPTKNVKMWRMLDRNLKFVIKIYQKYKLAIKIQNLSYILMILASCVCFTESGPIYTK